VVTVHKEHSARLRTRPSSRRDRDQVWPTGQDAVEAFYRVVDAAYESRSVTVTSNIHPDGLDTIMPKTLATATVDSCSMALDSRLPDPRPTPSNIDNHFSRLANHVNIAPIVTRWDNRRCYPVGAADA